MKTLIASLVLSIALIAGCATAPRPAQQELLLSLSIAAVIEKSKDPVAVSKIVLDIASMPLSVESLAAQIKPRIGYDKLTATQRMAVDALLEELDHQIGKRLTAVDKDATLAMWRRAAVKAASTPANSQ
jgi:hypothetical protein